MSKSNKKQPDRLKDSIHHDRLRNQRHLIKQLIKEGRLEDIDEVEEDFSCSENIQDDENRV